jgi:hypothetical protein
MLQLDESQRDLQVERAQRLEQQQAFAVALESLVKMNQKYVQPDSGQRGLGGEPPTDKSGQPGLDGGPPSPPSASDSLAALAADKYAQPQGETGLPGIGSEPPPPPARTSDNLVGPIANSIRKKFWLHVQRLLGLARSVMGFNSSSCCGLTTALNETESRV